MKNRISDNSYIRRLFLTTLAQLLKMITIAGGKLPEYPTDFYCFLSKTSSLSPPASDFGNEIDFYEVDTREVGLFGGTAITVNPSLIQDIKSQCRNTTVWAKQTEFCPYSDLADVTMDYCSKVIRYKFKSKGDMRAHFYGNKCVLDFLADYNCSHVRYSNVQMFPIFEGSLIIAGLLCFILCVGNLISCYLNSNYYQTIHNNDNPTTTKGPCDKIMHFGDHLNSACGSVYARCCYRNHGLFSKQNVNDYGPIDSSEQTDQTKLLNDESVIDDLQRAPRYGTATL